MKAIFILNFLSTIFQISFFVLLAQSVDMFALILFQIVVYAILQIEGTADNYHMGGC